MRFTDHPRPPNLAADWSGCSDTMSFAPGRPNQNRQQPPVKIVITSKCKKGEAVTIPSNAPLISIECAVSGAVSPS